MEPMKYFDYLMLDTLYDKREIEHNGGTISFYNIPPGLLKLQFPDLNVKKRLVWYSLYIAELNSNVYHLIPYDTEKRIPYKFKVVGAIISKHELA